MCLGIPGQIVELHPTQEHLARADVSGVGRMINIGLLEDEHLVPGDWVLIHVGFAMSKIDQAEADLALASLQMMGEMFTDEVKALMASPSSTTTGAITRGVSEQWDAGRAPAVRRFDLEHGDRPASDGMTQR